MSVPHQGELRPKIREVGVGVCQQTRTVQMLAGGRQKPVSQVIRPSTEKIYIDLPADLNLEDDAARNIARMADAVTPEMVTPARCW